jgi:hypothetical protein
MKFKQRFLLLTVALASFTNVSNAQLSIGIGIEGDGSGCIGGHNIVYGGLGFLGGLQFIGWQYTPQGYTSNASPSIKIGYERGLSDNFGLGVIFGSSSASMSYNGTIANTSFPPQYPNNIGQEYNYTNSYTFKGISFAVTGAYHFTVKENVDPYILVALGYASVNTTVTTNDPNTDYDNSELLIKGSGPIYGLYFGMRVFFTDNIGAWGEVGYLGYGGSILNIGLTGKF